MKRCPECRRDYTDETLNFCLDDGSALVDGPASLDDHKTAVLDSPSTGSRSYSDLPTRQFNADDIEITGPSCKRSGVSLAWLLAGFVLISVVGYGVYFVTTRSKEVKTDRSSKPIEIQRLTGDGRTRNPTISPDGKFLVYTKLEDGKESLWIKQVQASGAANVVKPGEASGIFGTAFSPDGNFVYFNANLTDRDRPTIYRVPTLGNTPPVKFLEDALSISFSSDGKQISFRRVNLSEFKETVYVANIDGTNAREISSRRGKQFFTSAAAWSPDGKLLAAGIGDDDHPGKGAGVGLYEVENGNFQEFLSGKWDFIEDLAWHPSGDSLIVLGTDNAFVEGRVFEVTYPAGEIRQLTNDLNGHVGLSITTDGKSIVTGERYARSAVWVSPDLKPENAKQVMPSAGDTWGFSWTPDGRIVYSSDQSGYAEIWIMNADGSDARALTNDRIFKSVPYVSPDGRFIVYTSSNNGGQIERINIDGSGLKLLSKSIGSDNPHISPDGQWVVYSAFVEGVARIMRVPLEGGEEKLIVDSPAREPRYSNDGKFLACFLLVENTLQWNRLAILTADGGAPIKAIDVPGSVDVSRGPVWTPDDKAITLINSPGARQNLWLQPVDGGQARALTDFDNPGIARRDYSRDGKRIAIVRAEGIYNAIMITGFR